MKPHLMIPRAAGVLLSMLALVVVYFLSPGPLSALYQMGIVSEYVVYECPVWKPLDWAGHISIVGKFYEWYLPLWDVHPGQFIHQQQ